METLSRFTWLPLASCLVLACANVVEGEADENTNGFAGSPSTGSGGVSNTGGAGTGGAATGGTTSSGGSGGTDGSGTGGTASGGTSNTGGSASGGSGTGGAATGGTGGSGTGGSGTGGSGTGGTGGGMVGTCTPDVASHSQGRCGLTAVFQSKLYTCISQAAGVAGETTGCGTTGVYCSAIEPTNGAWGTTAWEYVQDCE